MVAKPLAMLVTVWTFIAAPAMCLGGLMDHACDDGDTRANVHHQDADHSDDGCEDSGAPAPGSHESDCAADPCARAVAVGRDRDLVSVEIDLPSPLQYMLASFDTMPPASAVSMLATDERQPGLPLSIHLAHPPLLT